ncbi:hypothetical protein EON64_04980, partial [archaeon]
AQPSNMPSSQPTESPTSLPSGQPSRQPSCQPSLQPSNQPSIQPSRQPSCQPTHQPSHQPSSQPSRQPSRQPSSRPTCQPTSHPTQPSGQPTSNPTLHPSTLPFFMKSKPPTFRPSTFRPSGQPSGQPSCEPSSQPSSHPTAQPTGVIVYYPEGSFPNLTDIRVSEVIYEELYVKRLRQKGGFDSWNLFLTSTIRNIMSSSVTKPIKLQLLSTSDLRMVASDTVICSNQSAVSSILSSLATASSQGVKVVCGTRTWFSKRCQDVRTALCVDCVNPCSSSSECTVNSDLFIAPSRTESSCPNFPNIARYLFVSFEDSSKPISLVSSVLYPSKFSIQVYLRVSQPAIVYCAAFKDLAPSTLGVITRRNFLNSSLSLEPIVTISGLQSNVKYDVYCMTRSLIGVSMTLQSVLNTKMSVQTLCCSRSLVMNVDAESALIGQSLIGALKLVLNVSPVDYMRVIISASLATSPGNTMVQLSGNQSVLFTNPGSLSEYISIPASWTSIVGRVYVSVSYELSQKGRTHFYQTIFSNEERNYFNVLDGNSVPSTPIVTNAAFNGDGSALQVLFSGETDRGGFTTSSQFPCAALFNFTETLSSFCLWLDLRSVLIQLPSESAMAVNDLIWFNGKTKAACKNESVCGGWNYSDPQFVSVQLPSGQALQEVKAEAVFPSVLPFYNPLILDFSYSQGSGGRRWLTFSTKVTGSANSSVAKANEYAITNRSDTSISFPSHFFEIGTYKFDTTLCNYVYKCSNVTTVVTVVNYTVPTVVIYGSATKTITRDVQLELYAGANQPENNLFVTWGVVKDGDSTSSVKSVSVETFGFKVVPYSLVANSIYEFTISVLDRSTLESASYTVEVLVEPMGIVALITGGSNFFVRQSKVLTLDASGSFDKDISPDLDRNAGLQFFWSCRTQFASDLGTSEPCLLTLQSNNTIQTAQYYASELAANSTSIVTVVVYDVSRTSSASVSVTVLPNSMPVVSIQSAPTGRRLNVDEQVSMAASVTSPLPGTAFWSTNDTSVNLLSFATTSVESVLTTDGFIRMNLALSPNALPAGSYVQFSLGFRLQSGQVMFSTVVLVTNSRPKPGMFSVSPTEGSSLIDYFALSVSLWSDEDLPLSYGFGYRDVVTGKLQSLSRATTKQIYTTLLPAGNGSGNSLQIYAQIFDSLSGYAYAYSTVSVAPASNDELLSFSNSLTSFAFSSSDVMASLQQGLSVVLSAVSKIDCSQAPSCGSLSREECSATANTCGPCLSSYLGDDGDANTPCYSLDDELLTRRSLLEASPPVTSCVSSTQCRSWQTCTNELCVSAGKSCPSGCNSRGACMFTQLDTGAPLNACTVDNSQCVATCVCSEGYSGSSCSYTNSSLLSAQSSRFQLLMSLYNLTTIQNADPTTAVTWLSMMNQIMAVPDETHPVMLTPMSTILNKILETGLNNSMYYDKFAGIVDLINLVATFSSNVSVNIRQANPPEGVVSFPEEYLLKMFANLTLQSMVLGQRPVTYIKPQLRMIVGAVETNTTDRSISLSSPLSSLERYNRISSFNYSMAAVGSASDVKVALLLMLPKQYLLQSRTSSEIQSSYRLLTIVRDFQEAIDEDTTVHLSLQNAMPEIYTYYTSPPDVFNVFCSNEKHRHVFECSNGDQLTVDCRVQFRGWINSTCAYTTFTPRCMRTDLFGSLHDDSCVTRSYDSNSTACECNANVYARQKGFDGSMQFVDITKTTQIKATTTRYDVSATPTVEPSKRPTLPPVRPEAFSLASTLAGDIKKSVTGSYVMVLSLALLLTGAYVVLSNRRKVVLREAMIEHEAFGGSDMGGGEE